MITQRYKYMCAHVMSPVCLHDNQHQTELAHGKDGTRQAEGCLLNEFDSFNITLRNNKNSSNNDRATGVDKDTVCLITNQ